MTIKFKLFYQLQNEGKLIRVYRLDDKILLSINDDQDPDNPTALDFEIPRHEIAPLGRALVSAWEAASGPDYGIRSKRRALQEFERLEVGEIDNLDEWPEGVLIDLVNDLKAAQEAGRLNVETNEGIETLGAIVNFYESKLEYKAAWIDEPDGGEKWRSTRMI